MYAAKVALVFAAALFCLASPAVATTAKNGTATKHTFAGKSESTCGWWNRLMILCLVPEIPHSVFDNRFDFSSHTTSQYIHHALLYSQTPRTRSSRPPGWGVAPSFRREKFSAFSSIMRVRCQRISMSQSIKPRLLIIQSPRPHPKSH